MFAQAAAFVAVLAIGGLTGHGGKATPGPSSSSSTRPAPSISVTSAGSISTARKTQLTIVIEQAGGVVMPSVPVDVFKEGLAPPPVPSATSTPGVAGTPTEVVMLSVPAGHTYQVCVERPTGWTFTDPSINTNLIAGWGCTKVEVGSAAQTVPFAVALQSSDSGTVP